MRIRMGKLWFCFLTLSVANMAGGAEQNGVLRGSHVGATDYYTANCPSADTDHLAFKLSDTSAPPSDQRAQVLNVRVKKKASLELASASPGKTREASVQGGNGSYQVVVDTSGTDASLTDPQSYLLTFQCLDGVNAATKTSIASKSGSLKLKKRKSYTVKCSKNPSTGAATDRMQVGFSNTTAAAGQVLNAQVVRNALAKNATDGNTIEVAGGKGEYFVTVDNTGVDASTDSDKQYLLAAQCLTAGGQATVEPVFTLIQDE